jgi:asparagine synthase (glutamine-hydrolysing)
MAYFLHSPNSNSLSLGEKPTFSWKTDNLWIFSFFTSDKDYFKIKWFENALFVCLKVGNVFTFDSFESASEQDILESISKENSSLGNLFLGNYAIIILNKKTSEISIFSDPCGQFPLFFRKDENDNLHIGQHVSDFVKIGQFASLPDRDFLCSFLCHGSGSFTSTGLEYLSRIPPGHRITYGTERKTDIFRFWNPLLIKKKYEPQDPVTTLTRIINSILNIEEKIILELSGGLESTCLALGLLFSRLNSRTTALTYIDARRASSNEASIARGVAAACQMRHVTFDLSEKLPFAPCSTVPAVAIPSPHHCYLAQSKHFANTIQDTDFVVNGHGGDALFFALPPPFAYVDPLSRKRFVRAMTAVWDLAVLHRLPIWTILRSSKSAISRRDIQHGHSKLSPALLKYNCAIPHGIYDDIITRKSLLFQPARRYQIASLAATIDEIIGASLINGNRLVMPFLSQPIIEMALSHQVEDSFSSYHNRLPIRQSAYKAANLPNLWRSDKGDTTYSDLLGILKHKDEVEEKCLEGWCAREGLIDRSEMAKAIQRATLGYPADLPDISRTYSIEKFIEGIKV